MAVLLAAAGSSLLPTLLLRGVRVRATVKVPGKTFSDDSCSFSSICKAEDGERPKKSLKPHNDDDNPQFPCSRSSHPTLYFHVQQQNVSPALLAPLVGEIRCRSCAGGQAER